MSTVSGGPGPAGADHVLPFQLDALGVRGRLVRLGPALDSIIERHGYPLAVARPLAEAMVLCATLATSLKYDGIFTLQITGDGPIRLLVTDLTTDGALRGYAQFDSWKLAVALGAGKEEAPEGYVPKLFGHGRLAFTVDQGPERRYREFLRILRGGVRLVVGTRGSVFAPVRDLRLIVAVLAMSAELERMGDHATNIAETVNYMIEGKPVTDQRPKGDTTSFAALRAAGDK